MKTFKGYQQHLAEEIANSAIHDKLVATGVVGKHSKRTEPRVFNPGDKLSNADFIKLIKTTFDGVDKVTAIPPPNIKSRTNAVFNFDWEGVDYSVTLAGEVKGRGSKQTNEQEVSWLLILSAMYYNMDKVRNSGNPFEQAILNEMLDPAVYERVYGVNGNALNKSAAQGLVTWLSNNKDTWLAGHLKQCSACVNSHLKQCTPRCRARMTGTLQVSSARLELYAVPAVYLAS